MKIERRHKIVSLYQGNYQAQLDDLLDRASAALRKEAGAGPRRAGEGLPESMKLAKEHDELIIEAEENAVKVTVWEISDTEYQRIGVDHPPRDDNEDDKRNGFNMKTFPKAIARVAISDKSLDFDELSPFHANKLGAAAWNLHNADDALPKFSLVSQLMAMNEAESKEPSEQG